MSKKNFCLLQILIVTMLVICLLVNTYAWSDRGSESGSKLSLNYQSVVNGTVDEAKTFWIVNDAEQAIEGGAEFDVSEGDVLNFKTVVTNVSDNSVPTNVSLFLQDACFVANVDAFFTVSVSSPTQEYRMYGSIDSQPWVRIIPSYEVGAGATAVIEWSVRFVKVNELDDFTSGRFTFGDIVLEHF